MANWNVVDHLLNDVHAKAGQNNKTVECQLRETYSKIAATEANIFLFKTLKSMDIATNDIASFVKKQTNLKKASSRPDIKVLRAAMRSKLSDALSFAKRLRQRRDALCKRLVKRASSKSQGRRICSELASQYLLAKERDMVDARKKIEHLKS